MVDYMCIGNMKYYILSEDMFPKLNYNLELAYYKSDENILRYVEREGKIMKSLCNYQDCMYDSIEKTQAQYDEEYAILNSGKVMDVEIKDFTAENLGL